MLVHYLSHPQVDINSDIPVSSWGLNHTGKARILKAIEAGWLNGISRVVSSAEVKAIETANPIAQAMNVSVEIRQAMHENDRTATGYLPSEEFELVANEFFANPHKNIRGWEKAIDAQRRIVSETEKVLRNHNSGDLLIVGHGAVGTLLFCHYSNFQISRQYDQKGSGNYFSFLKDKRQVLHGWRPMEHKP